MTYEEKLQVNAALGDLLKLPTGSPEWVVPARIVVRHASQIPESSVHILHFRRKKSGRNISGYTDEMGTVDIQVGKPTVVEKTFGMRLERIGYYKLHRIAKTIYIQHFWNSSGDIEAVPMYRLIFQKLEPVSFGEEENIIYEFSHFWFLVVYVKYIQGKHLGKRKLGGWEFKMIKM